MTPGLPLGPHPSNAFAFAPGLPSSWPATLQPLALVASPKLGLRHKIGVESTEGSFTSIYTPWDLTQGGLHGNFVPMWLVIGLKVN
jgi:hypothetical protein